MSQCPHITAKQNVQTAKFPRLHFPQPFPKSHSPGPRRSRHRQPTDLAGDSLLQQLREKTGLFLTTVELQSIAARMERGEEVGKEIVDGMNKVKT